MKLGPIRAYRLSDLDWKEGPFPGSRIAVLTGDPRTGMHHTYLELPDGAWRRNRSRTWLEYRASAGNRPSGG